MDDTEDYLEVSAVQSLQKESTHQATVQADLKPRKRPMPSDGREEVFCSNR